MLTLITNRKIVKDGNYFSTIKKAIEGGVDAIILREKDLPQEELLSMAKAVKEIIGERKVLLIINSNVEVARAVEANGIQLSFDSFVNNKVDVNFDGIVGVSVHSLQEALAAEMKGASYVLASHVFETACKAGLEPKGLEFIKEIKEKVSIPVIALGGITPENVRDVIDLGVEGVAVMSGIMAAEDAFVVDGESSVEWGSLIICLRICLLLISSLIHGYSKGFLLFAIMEGLAQLLQDLKLEFPALLYLLPMTNLPGPIEPMT